MTLIPRLLIAASALLVGALGALHLLLTYRGSKLLPRDRDLRSRMTEVSPVITTQTTMWKSWIGFNASHSAGLILFGLVYGYLALRKPEFLFGSAFLIGVGLLFLSSFVFLSLRYFFSRPLQGVLLATVLYVAGILSSRAS